MKLNIDFQRLEQDRASINAQKAKIGEINAKRSLNLNPIEIKLLARGFLVLSGE